MFFFNIVLSKGHFTKTSSRRLYEDFNVYYWTLRICKKSVCGFWVLSNNFFWATIWRKLTSENRCFWPFLNIFPWNWKSSQYFWFV